MSNRRTFGVFLSALSICAWSAACGGTHTSSTPDAGTDANTSQMDASNPCQACDTNAMCSPGSTPLCTCKAGFAGNGTSCADIDECATNNGGCSMSPPVVCTNTSGSRMCGTCPLGYSGDGVTCTDIDECAINNGGCSMSPPVACTNLVGSSMCASCPSGYSGDGATCTDVDECATNNGGCSSTPLVMCHNSPGSSSCDACPGGYTGDGMTCTDSNECVANTDGCGATQRCSNTPGSFACVTCVGAEVLVGAPGANETCQCAGHDIVDQYTVIDTAHSVTFEWLRYDDQTPRSWAGADAYCAGLTLGGKSDWRLPTIAELMTIVDFSPGVAPYINLCAFPTTMATGGYWTSEEAPGDPSKHMMIDFSDGMAYSQVTSGPSQAGRLTRCFRP